MAKTGKFSEIADVLVGVSEDSTPSKDHGRKNNPNYRPCSNPGFTAVFLRRIGSTASWEYPTLVSIYRGSKPVPQKLTGMAVNRLKDHTGYL